MVTTAIRAATTARATTEAHPIVREPQHHPGSYSDRQGRSGDSAIAFDRAATGDARTDAPRDDEALRIVKAVLDGDRDAFRVLVDREAASTVRACHRILGDLHEAEDAAQETFVIAFRSLDSWRATGSFGAWLRRIAVRVALRRASSRRPVLRLDPISMDADDASLGPAGRLASSAQDPADASLMVERAVELRRALQTLDDPYREVVLLRFYGDLSLAEIALETGRPVATIKTHLRRGLLRLRSAAAGLGLDQ
jgi:RNA polymerase sigma-70 factor (ECF subfamily)